MRKKILIIFCILLVYTNGQDIDKSFLEMCSFWNGKHTSRDNGFQSMTGDTCILTFEGVATNTEEEAITYCETNVPFHINKAVPDSKDTVCHAEATLMCASGWIQMFGKCYKIEKKMMTREDAVMHCAGQEPQSTIAFMHREALPFRIYDYFSSVSRIWFDASEAITNDLIYDVPGGNLLLALDGYKYNLPNIALARVAPDEKAMVLCEYTPKMNQAESNYLLRRFSEIYHPTIFTSDTAYVRSASVLQRDDNNTLRDTNYCKKVLRPFLQTDNAQSAVPTRELLDKLKENRVAEIIRTSVYSGDAKKASRINGECSNSQAKNYGMAYPNNLQENETFFKSMKDDPIWRENQPKEVCDGATWSTGIVLSRSKDFGLEAMSDATYAPIYCQTNFDIVGYGDCPSDFKTYKRATTKQKYCHKFVNELVDFDTAEEECQKLKAHVSGFDDEDELNFLDGMLDEAIEAGTTFDNSRVVWIGAKRRKNCDRLGMVNVEGGFNPDPNHACSRRRVFEWANGVARNPPMFETLWAHPIEPNFVNSEEQCIELLKGWQKRPSWTIDGDKKLNDVDCSLKHYFFCGKEAPVVSKKKTV